jgi:hypothetical protein
MRRPGIRPRILLEIVGRCPSDCGGGLLRGGRERRIPGMVPRCYSRRLLQPFRGTSQVVAVRGGEAETTDGVHWVLYAMDERIVTHTGLSEVRYGTWDPHHGLMRARIRGTGRASLIEAAGRRLVEALESCAHAVPFEAADHHECWLVAADDRNPLLLLETAVDAADRSVIHQPGWRPGIAELNEFDSPRGDVRRLAALVAEKAGRRPQAFWCERQADGSGATDKGCRLPAECFPALLLREAWPEQEAGSLVRDFLAWQAPWLLQLSGLDRATRRWLEASAWQRPVIASRSWRLYPELYDTEGLRVARVKAMLAGETVAAVPVEPFYPFLNE